MAEEPSSEPTAENYNLREELARYRGVLRWFCGSFEQSDTAEGCGVAWRWVQSAANHSQGNWPVIWMKNSKSSVKLSTKAVSFRIFRALVERASNLFLSRTGGQQASNRRRTSSEQAFIRLLSRRREPQQLEALQDPHDFRFYLDRLQIKKSRSALDVLRDV